MSWKTTLYKVILKTKNQKKTFFWGKGFSMGFKPKKVATSFRGFGFVAAQDLPLPPWASNMQMMSPLLFAYEEGARSSTVDTREPGS